MPISPDVPAYINYLVVIASGVIVAISTVNTLLSQQPDRWAFFRTWMLALAHLAIPPLLFWFLDYTEAIHDTSLFVALVVGFGYRQIFAGGIQGITLPGQTPALWKPFESWVARVIDGIAIKNKEYRDRFDDTSKAPITASPDKLARLEELATVHSSNPPTLAGNLAAARGLFVGTHLDTMLTDLLWDDLRQSKPKRYAYLLRNAGLVPAWKVWWWFDKGRSKTVISVVLLAGLLAFTFAGPLGLANREPLLLRYNHWRVLKDHVTPRDRYRSLAYLDAQLAALDETLARQDKKIDPREPLRRQLGLLVDELRFVDLPEATAERIVSLVLRSRAALEDDATVRSLIDALWTENGAVRARVNRGLVQIQKKAYPSRPLPDGLSTAPESGEAFEAIDHRVRLWREWWAKRLEQPAPPTPASTPVVEGVRRGRYVVEVSFGFNSAALPPELKAPLDELGALLKQNEGWRLRVEAHTDNIGSDGANLALSRRRGAAVVTALTGLGVPAERLAVRAVGEREPRAPNDTEEGRQRNRRVEFVRTDGEFSQ